MFDLRKFRHDYNLTQLELTKILNCTQPYLSSIENLKKELPKDKYIILENKFGNIQGYITDTTNTSTLNSINAQTNYKNLLIAFGSVDKLVVEISEQRKMFAGQIDRLLTLLENR